MEVLAKFLELLKSSPAFILLLASFAFNTTLACVLFFSEGILKPFHLEKVRDKFGEYLGGGFLFLTLFNVSLFIYLLIHWKYKLIRDNKQQRAANELVQSQERAAVEVKYKRLSGLTRHEKALIGRFINEDSRCIESRANQAELSLYTGGIITQVGGAKTGEGLPWSGCQVHWQIADWVWDYLKQHPELLK